jgi:hypothetical protein
MTAMMAHLAIVVVTILSVGCASAVEEPPFKITTKHDNDKVEVNVENDKAVISVCSPFGISQAVIERSNKRWPDTVILRLHLKGLENFKVTNGKITLEAAVSSQNSRQWKDGKEDSPLEPKSPCWMEIRAVGMDGKPATIIPLTDGYFEIQLPKAFFEDNSKSITVNWIDFYR